MLTEPLSCVYYGLTKLAQVPIGSSILVTGAGIIGNLWSAVLHHVGHRNVIVAEPLAGRRTLNENLGSNTVFEINTVVKINSYLYSRTPHNQTLLRDKARVKYKLDSQKSNKTFLQVEKYAYKKNMATKYVPRKLYIPIASSVVCPKRDPMLTMACAKRWQELHCTGTVFSRKILN